MAESDIYQQWCEGHMTDAEALRLLMDDYAEAAPLLRSITARVEILKAYIGTIHDHMATRTQTVAGYQLTYKQGYKQKRADARALHALVEQFRQEAGATYSAGMVAELLEKHLTVADVRGSFEIRKVENGGAQ